MAAKTAVPRPTAGKLGEAPTRRARAAAATTHAGTTPPIEIAPGSGNVFSDLDVPDAGERLAKALLSRIIQQQVRELGWTQRAAASALGIATSDMSDLMRGKLARFSQERLERMLNALDLDVVIHVGPRPAWKERAGVSVTRVKEFAR